MDILIFITSFLLIVLLALLFQQTRKKNIYKNKIVEEFEKDLLKTIAEESSKLEEWKTKKKQEQQDIEQKYNERKEIIQETIDQYQLRQSEAEQAIGLLIKNQQLRIDAELSSYRQTQQANIDKALEQASHAANQQLSEYLSKIDTTRRAAEEDLSKIQKQLDDFRLRQTAINEEISRQKKLEERQDFYRIVLSENTKQDIEILQSIKSKLGNPAILDKLIYDAYIAAPAAEMAKRVLSGRAVSGIYKITRLKTGEIYIGKAVDVKARWLGHSKTVFNVGTIAHSMLHTTMEKDGIDNFTFELLEEVPKDQLTEREKYWINFYDSKNYGLNMRCG